MNSSFQDPAAVREQARQILSQSEFRSSHGWLARLYGYLIHPLSALGDGWNWLIAHLPWREGPVTAMAWVVVVLIVLGAVGFLLRLGRSTVVDSGMRIDMAPLFSMQSAAELLRIADAFEANGEWREAMRARYGALIAHLAMARIVHRESGRTTGEYAREVTRNAPEIAMTFGDVTTLFEVVWYGNVETNAEVARQFREAAAAVLKFERAA